MRSILDQRLLDGGRGAGNAGRDWTRVDLHGWQGVGVAHIGTVNDTTAR